MKQIVSDEWIEVPASSAHAVLPHVDDARVQLVLQEHPDRLRAQRLAAPIAQASGRHAVENLLLREAAGGVLLEGASHDRRTLGIVQQALAHRTRRVDVAERRQEHPASNLERGLHAGFGAVRAHVVVELGEGGKDAFHEFACGRVVDRLGRRPQRNAQRLQKCAQREVIVLLACEAGQIEDDEKMNAALVGSAERQHPLQFGTVRGLRAFAFFPEPFEDLETFPAAVLFAGSKLSGE